MMMNPLILSSYLGMVSCHTNKSYSGLIAPLSHMIGNGLIMSEDSEYNSLDGLVRSYFNVSVIPSW